MGVRIKSSTQRLDPPPSPSLNLNSPAGPGAARFLDDGDLNTKGRGAGGVQGRGADIGARAAGRTHTAALLCVHGSSCGGGRASAGRGGQNREGHGESGKGGGFERGEISRKGGLRRWGSCSYLQALYVVNAPNKGGHPSLP